VEAQQAERVRLVAQAVAVVLMVAQALLLAAQVHLDKAMLVEMDLVKRLTPQLEEAGVLEPLAAMPLLQFQVMVVLV
jgi:hypothetical protein